MTLVFRFYFPPYSLQFRVRWLRTTHDRSVRVTVSSGKCTIERVSIHASVYRPWFPRLPKYWLSRRSTLDDFTSWHGVLLSKQETYTEIPSPSLLPISSLFPPSKSIPTPFEIFRVSIHCYPILQTPPLQIPCYSPTRVPYHFFPGVLPSSPTPCIKEYTYFSFLNHGSVESNSTNDFTCLFALFGLPLWSSHVW